MAMPNVLDIKMRLVKVVWVDSYGVSPVWVPLDEVQPVCHACVSVGYLLVDGDDVKVLVPHVSPENQKAGAVLSGIGDMSIPTRAVLSMVDLQEIPE